MAGSGSRPLTNIPYCCLPQESGPCLSASVGDRPLRSPSHRRLGGPSPRRQSNGTHARPVPRLRFAPEGMPLRGVMADYPAFPPAIRPPGVGCIRVAHPSAALILPEGKNPARLACIRPAASVHPEPGSNSSLYYCLSNCIPCLGSRLRCYKGSFPLGPDASRRNNGPSACAGLRLSKNSPPVSPLPVASIPRKAGAKVQPFPITTSTFFGKILIWFVLH